ncbi:uncharacterized protein PSFLO_03224 [Pseudozyma flocculosa]|uniref:Uncharacterized protein n=1 Tax=Pseudozyma flocculosa TaxID=84751 RepID=A0A5C3EZY4_9BASI|nr:uncharacterized protein PSFLO_03224 [Pseudozyma flocculosa]
MPSPAWLVGRWAWARGQPPTLAETKLRPGLFAGVLPRGQRLAGLAFWLGELKIHLFPLRSSSGATTRPASVVLAPASAALSPARLPACFPGRLAASPRRLAIWVTASILAATLPSRLFILLPSGRDHDRPSLARSATGKGGPASAWKCTRVASRRSASMPYCLLRNVQPTDAAVRRARVAPQLDDRHQPAQRLALERTGDRAGCACRCDAVADSSLLVVVVLAGEPKRVAPLGLASQPSTSRCAPASRSHPEYTHTRTSPISEVPLHVERCDLASFSLRSSPSSGLGRV